MQQVSATAEHLTVGRRGCGRAGVAHQGVELVEELRVIQPASAGGALGLGLGQTLSDVDGTGDRKGSAGRRVELLQILLRPVVVVLNGHFQLVVADRVETGLGQVGEVLAFHCLNDA